MSGLMCVGNMAEESWRYRNPEHIGDRLMQDDWYQTREEYGCSACANSRMVWGIALCELGREPGPRGFCKLYREAG